MNLYLLRHGIAVDTGTPGFAKDEDRPLTPKGKRRVRQIAGAMMKLELSFDLILSSPYVRARQTAEIVAPILGSRKKLGFTDALTPGGNPKSLIEDLLERPSPPENVLLVGHEPYLSRLISLLLSGNLDLPVTLKKGGLCKLTAGSLRFGSCASLDWLLTPKQMACVAGTGRAGAS